MRCFFCFKFKPARCPTATGASRKVSQADRDPPTAPARARHPPFVRRFVYVVGGWSQISELYEFRPQLHVNVCVFYLYIGIIKY